MDTVVQDARRGGDTRTSARGRAARARSGDDETVKAQALPPITNEVRAQSKAQQREVCDRNGRMQR